MSNRRWLAALAAALMLVPAAAQDATQEATLEPVTLPAKIAFTAPVAGLRPEGIEWDAAHNRFLVGSLAVGTIHGITVAEDGTTNVEPFVEDEDLGATVGLEIDEANNALLVANSSTTAFGGGAGAAGLAAYDLDTGERLYIVDLDELYESKTNFANDVAVDSKGNAYVTNSFAPVLYKVTPEGEASVFIEDEQLSSPSGIGTNGIVYDPDSDTLLVINGETMSLLRVTLGDEVEIVPVELDTPLIADGMVLAEDGTLYAVASESGQDQYIASLVSEDGWESAAVLNHGKTTGAATTITLVGDRPYYINAYLGDMSRTEYQIVGVDVSVH